MKLLRIAVENQRWDLAAHTIVLAIASVLQNGDKPRASPRASNNPSLKISGGSAAGQMTLTRRREFAGKKRGAAR